MSKFYKRKQEEEVENFKKLLDDKKRVKYCGYRQRLIENIIYIFKDYEMVIVESVSVIKTYVRKDAENKYKTFLNQTKNKEK